MENVAFLGLGAMGSRMAARLVAAGHHLVVWNRTASKAQPLADLGARVASTPADAVGDAAVAITMLANPYALRDVVMGETGVAAGIRPDATLIEMSTVGPASVRWLREALPESVRLIDAPVLGSLPEVESGRLTIFAGGDEDDLDRCQPLLELFGTVMRIGATGSGAAAKLVANSALLGVLGVLGESLALADALGLARDDVFRVLSATPLAAQAERRRPALESGDFSPRYALYLAHKDADLMAAAAADAGIALPVIAAVRDWLAGAEEAGHGGDDYTALLRHILTTGGPE